MDDAFLVRVLYRLTDGDKQPEPFMSRNLILVAELGDLDAAHQFHDEIGSAGVRRAGIEHLRDVRVIHQGQSLPLGLEPGDDRFGVHAQLNYLERHAAADRFLLLGHVHDPAASLADLLQDFVAPNSVTGLFVNRD